MKFRLIMLSLILALVLSAIRHKSDWIGAADRLLGHPPRTEASATSNAAIGAGAIAPSPSGSAPAISAPADGVPADSQTAGADENLAADGLYSSNAILVRLDDGKILMDKRIDERVYPASLTKIMTSILAIENISDLQAKIELDPDMFKRLQEQDASMAGYLPGERVRAIDLLYGTMLPSGAEASVGLATRVAGSERKFAALMNKKAKALGMKHTHFTNATGLHDPEHYTTARDLSVLLRYALQDETFRKLFTTSRYSAAPTKQHPEGITFGSTMFKELSTARFEGGEIEGGKTGYTEKAGLCLASLGRKDGREYILITTGAKGNHKTEAYHIADAMAVYGELGKAL